MKALLETLVARSDENREFQQSTLTQLEALIVELSAMKSRYHAKKIDVVATSSSIYPPEAGRDGLTLLSGTLLDSSAFG